MGGGCELALVCDMRIASETARFGLPEIKIGVMPAAGGPSGFRALSARRGPRNSCLSGDFIDAREAYRIGLVNRVVPADRLMDEARELAGKLIERPPLSLKYIKRAVNVGMGLDLGSALDYEAQCASILYAVRRPPGGHAGLCREAQARIQGMLVSRHACNVV